MAEILAGEKVADMAELGVDIARISADSLEAFNKISAFKKQLTQTQHYSLNSVEECNGYWHQIAGMSVA